MPKKAFPKTPGGLADAMYKQDQVIKEINRTLTEAKAFRKELEEHAFTVFKNQDLEGARGKAGQASISHTLVPQVETPDDWLKVFRWIMKNKDFSILQKRLAVTHIRELWDDSVNIPGVKPYAKIGLSVTKVKAKKK